MTQQTILTPPGRIVRGDLYQGYDTNAEGQPLTVKTGPNIGKPRIDYFFAVAIPKAGEAHWSATPWGAIIAAVGMGAFPQAYQAATFAWKVVDGDSQVKDLKGRTPSDGEGYKGHWVLSFSSGYPPKVYTDGGERLLPEPNAVKPGYWIQVSGTVDGNGSTQRPGVYLNHNLVCFVRADAEIKRGPDATAVGFQKGGGMPPGVIPGAGAVGFAPPGTPTLVAPVVPAAVVAPPATAVAPSFSLLMPAVPAVPPARRMTGLANGATYEALIAGGWTDALLLQHGLMLA